MKVRLALPGGQRKALALHPDCTLNELRVHIAGFIGADTFDVSFNKRDVLGGAANATLRELGVCSGDLLWVVGLDDRAQATVARPEAAEVAEPELQRIKPLSPPPHPPLPQAEPQQADKQQELAVLDRGKRAAAASTAASDEGVDEQDEQELPPSQRLPTYFLRTVQHSCSNDTQSAEVLLLAAHAAMLETGFVPAWSGSGPGGPSGSMYSMYQVPRTCWVSTGTCKISYHLAGTSVARGSREELGANLVAPAGGIHQPPVCTLQCSSLGGGDIVLAVASRTHTRHIPMQAATYVCAASKLAAATAGGCSSGDTTGARPALAESIVELLADGGLSIAGRLHMDPGCTRRLWTAVKDALAFPMLLAAYAEAGLPAPAGMLALPEDLKLRLLNLLGPLDLAACACVCSELRHLAAQDELWRRLFETEFPKAPSHYASQAPQRGYKWAFAACWQQRRQREDDLRRARPRFFVPGMPHFVGVPRPTFHPPLGGLGIGGDYDRLPQFGPGTGLPGQFGSITSGGFFTGIGRRQGRGGFRLQ